MSSISKKTMAIAMAATVSLAGPVGASMTPAFAQPTGGEAGAPASAARLDINATTTLTVAKQVGEPGSGTAAGAGFTFRAERVQTAPLNTQAGWNDVSRIIAGGAENAPIDTTFTAVEQTTDANGNAVFNSLGVGLFRITELRNGNYTVARPFLVTLPLTENGAYNYNPSISPKNQELKPTKEADDTGVTVGQNIHYTIEAPVPVAERTREGVNGLTKFSITDNLPAELRYAANTATVLVGNVGTDGVFTEIPGAIDAQDYTLTTSDQQLVVDFTATGLQKLQQLRDTNPALNVQLAFDATVVQIPANGRIENTAQVGTPNSETNINTQPKNDNEGTDGPKVTQFANVEITKTVSGGAADATGNGAQFQVFKCTEAGNGSWNTVGDALALTNEAGTQALTDRNITADGGTATANAVARGFGFQVDQEADYCAVETKAPAGFVANPDPFPLTMTTASSETQRAVYTAEINNAKDSVWGNLPSTGERTMLIMLAIGALLFAGGAAYQLNRRNAA